MDVRLQFLFDHVSNHSFCFSIKDIERDLLAEVAPTMDVKTKELEGTTATTTKAATTATTTKEGDETKTMTAEATNNKETAKEEAPLMKLPRTTTRIVPPPTRMKMDRNRKRYS